MADEARVDRDPGLVHRGAVAVEPGAAAQDPLGSADDADPAMPEREQVAGRRQAAVPVGRPDRRRVVERFAGRIDHDERDAARAELRAHGLAEVREDRDHAHRPAGEHALDPPATRRPTALHLREHHRQLMPPGHPLDAADDLERPLALEFVEDDLEERGDPRRPLRADVAVLPDGRLDTSSRRRRDVRAAVDDLRDGRHGHAGLLRDERDRGGSSGLARLPIDGRCHGPQCSESETSPKVSVAIVSAPRRRGIGS